MLWLFFLAAIGPPTTVPDSALVGIHRDPDISSQLVALRQLEQAYGPSARPLGLDYLHGDLLERSGRLREAAAAFATSLRHTPELAPYGRYRLAKIEFRLDHPETAAGLVVEVLRQDPPRALLRPATRLLHEAIDAGGDCRLLEGAGFGRLPRPQQRSLEVALGECLLLGGRIDEGRQLLFGVLARGDADESAREAAEHLDELGGATGEERLHLARTLHQHRRFDRALAYLEPLAEQLPAEIRVRRDYEVFYLLARCYFRLERHRDAATTFGRLAWRTIDPSDRAKAFYQQGRSLELAGRRLEAGSAFVRAANITPESAWTGAAILAALRLQWTSGETEAAEKNLELLASRRSWASFFSRGALFMASTDLVQGRTDRAGSWLRRAAQQFGGFRSETDYWLGRWEEARGRLEPALGRYLKVLQQLEGQPLALETSRRLASEPLATVARAQGRRLLGSSRPEDRLAAWLLLRPGPDGPQARASAIQLLSRDRRAASFLHLATVEPAQWPLWSQPLVGAEQRLLALGQWADVERRTVLAAFPVEEPALAFTASERLRDSGAIRPSVYIAEVLQQGAARTLPAALLPEPYRRALFPLPWAETIRAAAARHGTDPALLAAIIREESRFDPEALSAAGARGLTQFVLPTAHRIAADIGLPPPTPGDLFRPPVSIELGAAYLAALALEIDDQPTTIAAAYNAGEPQVRLWQSYCVSTDPGELFTKIGFKETREYVARVLRSQGNYLQLYPELRP